jgi:hypothetical protein
MPVSVKVGTDFLGLHPALVVAIFVAEDAFHTIARANCVVTSASDGEHSRKSLHYVGHAVDLRTRHVPKHLHEQIRDRIAQDVGDQFDVVLEPTHIHVEWQPKT